MTTIDWLPKKILETIFATLADFLSAVEESYKDDFVRSEVFYNNIPVKRKKFPLRHNGEDASFWHMTTTGSGEDNRKRSIERCQRIKWPKAIIQHCEDSLVNVWTEEKRILFHFKLSEIDPTEKDYLVILDSRGKYLVLWTAYPIDWEHSRRKLLKRFRDAT